MRYPTVVSALGLAGAVSAHAVPPPVAAAAASVDCTGVNAISPKCRSSEALYSRDVFYVGGRSVASGFGNILADQVYVEKLTPSCGVKQLHPLVFFHGGANSAVTWLNTPDNRKGFASYFLEKGYMVYLVDQIATGRSAQQDTTDFALANSTTIEIVQGGFSAPELAATYPQAILHTQWPGSGQAGDPIFEAFAHATVPYTTSLVAGENAMRASICKLLSLVGASYLVSHSSGAQYPILVSNDCPELVAGNINLEHSTQPFWNYGTALGSGSAARAWGLANTHLDYEPPVSDPSELQVEVVGEDTLALRNCHLQAEPARRLPKIASVPYLCTTGEASVHMTYDHCVIEFLKQAGGNPDWIKLADVGIHGNGHFGHLEKNNMDIAAVVEGWIKKQDANKAARV
ncbi:secreted lipase [Apiospora kogelbergensis]|uniref:Secreted lipase n=1 Tax=Apiospora kogelbergensis TaxID=1337665 RepID=A0AAW0QQY1_9PEZI